MQGVWQTLRRAGLADDAPIAETRAAWHPEWASDADIATAQFFMCICSLIPMIADAPDDAQYIGRFAPVVEREEQAGLLALRLREIAAQLRELCPRGEPAKGVPVQELGLRWGVISEEVAGETDALERIADTLEFAVRWGARQALRPAGRNRGRVRERVFARDLAASTLKHFKLSANARYGVIATVISVVFENEIEPYRVRDWLKPE
jgi:hypothetical protein